MKRIRVIETNKTTSAERDEEITTVVAKPEK